MRNVKFTVGAVIFSLLFVGAGCANDRQGTSENLSTQPVATTENDSSNSENQLNSNTGVQSKTVEERQTEIKDLFRGL